MNYRNSRPQNQKPDFLCRSETLCATEAICAKPPQGERKKFGECILPTLPPASSCAIAIQTYAIAPPQEGGGMRAPTRKCGEVDTSFALLRCRDKRCACVRCPVARKGTRLRPLRTRSGPKGNVNRTRRRHCSGPCKDTREQPERILGATRAPCDAGKFPSSNIACRDRAAPARTVAFAHRTNAFAINPYADD
jgi:hypothetical protein